MASTEIWYPLLAEQELTKLQQQYRIMEGDRKAYSEESQNMIRKQQYVADDYNQMWIQASDWCNKTQVSNTPVRYHYFPRIHKHLDLL